VPTAGADPRDRLSSNLIKKHMRSPAIVLVAGVTLVACSTQPAPESSPAPAQSSLARRVGSISELMVDILYPAGDAVFYIETRTPTTSEEWSQLQLQTLALAETANLLMMPGRARDQDQWIADAQLMLDAGEAAYRAAKDRDVPALVSLNAALYQSCVTCHQHYRPGYGRR
jgi:cytochrome c556